MQSKIVIGIDPDSKASGFAFYDHDKQLKWLKSMPLVDIYQWLESNKFNSKVIELHIEDLNSIRCSSFNWHSSDNKHVRAKKSESVGKCKQAQIDIERMADHFEFKVVKHKVSKQWKDAKCKQFKLLTGWKGRSNEDTRSAAYFGYLGSR